MTSIRAGPCPDVLKAVARPSRNEYKGLRRYALNRIFELEAELPLNDTKTRPCRDASAGEDPHRVAPHSSKRKNDPDVSSPVALMARGPPTGPLMVDPSPGSTTKACVRSGIDKPICRWGLPLDVATRKRERRWAVDVVAMGRPLGSSEEMHRDLIHVDCGRSTHAVPSCAHCGEVLKRSNLRIEPGLGVVAQRSDVPA